MNGRRNFLAVLFFTNELRFDSRKLAKSTAILTVLFGLHYFLLAFPIHLLDVNTLNLPLIVFLFVEIIPISLQVSCATRAIQLRSDLF